MGTRCQENMCQFTYVKIFWFVEDLGVIFLHNILNLHLFCIYYNRDRLEPMSTNRKFVPYSLAVADMVSLGSIQEDDPKSFVFNINMDMF